MILQTKRDSPPPLADGGAEGPPCPTAGGSMRRLPASNGSTSYCIDRTEVRRSDYFAWLEGSPTPSLNSASCSSNEDFTPTCSTTGEWGLDRFLDNPITCVDWCDAEAYCRDHQKHLCGKRQDGNTSINPDGGTLPSRALPIDGYKDASQSEWYNACSSNEKYAFPYGNDYEHERCRESPTTGWGTVEVQSLSGCQSPDADYAGIFDLAGNLAEWEDSCDGERCRIRGGSYQHSTSGIRCDVSDELFWEKTSASGEIGFRCCAD